MEIKKKIGKRIAGARKKIGLSKVQLSEKSGFGISRLGNWEAGIRTPKLVDVKVLEDILGVTPPYLLCLVDNEDGTGENNFKSIPLFSESGLMPLINQSIATLEKTETLPLPPFCEHLLPQHPFAVRVFDNSMSPLYKKGTILVFLQGIEVKHNDIVLATFPGLQAPLIRKYFIDSSNIDEITVKLMPLNDDWVTNTVKDPSSVIIHGVLSNFETVIF
jgi:transcriptional regulator with XRE-family HTH domain